MLNRFRCFTLTLLVLLSACSREDGVGVDESFAVNEPDNFAVFLNPIAGLSSGGYIITAMTDTAGEVGDFVLTLTFDDGEKRVFEGSWTATVSEVAFEFVMQSAGGITATLESDVENNLRLNNENGFEISAVGALASGDTKLTLLSSAIDSEAYGAAYYAAIDPNNAKNTLEKFKVENGFYEAEAAGRVIQPRFRDVKDLGYGRGMRAWTGTDGSLYFFAENFQVRTIPGLEYTRLNLDALLIDDRKHHFGTNAIEFSTYPYGAGEPSDQGSTHKFTKFFTFDATQGSQSVEDHENEIRLNTVDLDDNGLKAMPGACVYCHGGTLRPLREDGTFRDNSLNGTAGNGINGDVNAKLQLMEVPSFEYADFSPFTRADQEPLIKQINLSIYCSYPNKDAAAIEVACAQFCVDPNDMVNCDGNGNSIQDIFQTSPDSVTGAGEWTGDFARETIEGWYDDPEQPAFFDRDTFNDDYVPDAWKPNLSTGFPPAGSDQLFLDVVQPACAVCHSRRGTTLGTNLAAIGDKDIDFSTYERFIAHAAQIKQYVYDRGIMPLSLRGYDEFWDESNDAPQILATHLNSVLPADNQIVFNSEDKVDQPGAPVADAGPDRTSTSPVRMFGANSRFVDTYRWTIVSQPDGSDAVLSEDTTARAMLTTSVDGDYEIQLDTSFGTLQSTDTVLIKVDADMLLNPKELTFEKDIRVLFETVQDPAFSSEADSKSCDGCHQEESGADAIAGVPVYWLDAQPATADTASNALYKEVLSRVNFEDPENSLLLLKPSGNHHYGGQRQGFEVTNAANRQHYDTVLNWIMEGAVEKAP